MVMTGNVELEHVASPTVSDELVQSTEKGKCLVAFLAHSLTFTQELRMCPRERFKGQTNRIQPVRKLCHFVEIRSC